MFAVQQQQQPTTNNQQSLIKYFLNNRMDLDLKIIDNGFESVCNCNGETRNTKWVVLDGNPIKTKGFVMMTAKDYDAMSTGTHTDTCKCQLCKKSNAMYIHIIMGAIILFLLLKK